MVFIATPMESYEENKSSFVACATMIQTLAEDWKRVQKLVRLDQGEFQDLLAAVRPSIEQTTTRGTLRQRQVKKTSLSPFDMVFLTLFWLAHYPTLAFISSFFSLHEREVTRVLKQTLAGMAAALQQEVQWPTEEEFVQHQNNMAYFHNWNFADIACVIDGTEIRVARPKTWDKQKILWSGKKHQHSLNVLFITRLDGIIIYYSPYRVGAHDQSHWNELNLRSKFVGSSFGICGDGGFTFNRKQDQEEIIGYKPYKKPKNGTLTEEQKQYNKRLSQMRVIVENTIARVKQWKILKGTFRHYHEDKGQLDLNQILTVVVALTNRNIRKTPLRRSTWTAADWNDIFMP